MFHKSLFIFRRDLRIEDNTGLIFALKSSKVVIASFILTPEQIDNNPLRNEHCIQFMITSLKNLEQEIKNKGGKLFFFHGQPEAIVQKCISDLKIDAVIVNRDYTPYSMQRDQRIEEECKVSHIPFLSFDDALLHPPEETLKKDGTPYTIFTPFYHNALQLKVSKPVENHGTNYFNESIPFANELKGEAKSEKINHLSPYLKFTVVSPRQVYYNTSNQQLIRSLYWRDFFTCIAFFFPYVFNGSFRPKFDRIKWSYNTKNFQRWCEGNTGFPIVDAGMREMNQTGFMQNRFRMIAASFLVKDLHIDWRWGEKYFAKRLIDYDPAVNNGNWQWVASTGCDAAPYFRLMNPWTQQKKFDPDCTYIRQWIPELRHVSSKIIHAWYEENALTEYPPPMLDHAQESKEAIKLYKELENN